MKRGRNQRRRQGGSNPNRALDSNGPDVRIRGTANQIYDKYVALARDASSAGDRVKAESYQQHAEHYFRVIRAMQPPPTQQTAPNTQQQPHQPQQQQQAVDAAEGDQPSVGGEGAAEDPGSERKSGGRTSDRKRDDSRARASASEDKASDSAEAVSGGDESEAEPKPKRRRSRRPAKAAAEPANAETAAKPEKEAATAAAE